MFTRKILSGIIVLVLVVFLTACTPTPTSTPVPPTPTPTIPTIVPRISVDEAYQLLGKPDVLFVDTREGPDEHYKISHIKGAISMPGSEVETRFKELPRDKRLILYCA